MKTEQTVQLGLCPISLDIVSDYDFRCITFDGDYLYIGATGLTVIRVKIDCKNDVLKISELEKPKRTTLAQKSGEIFAMQTVPGTLLFLVKQSEDLPGIVFTLHDGKVAKLNYDDVYCFSTFTGPVDKLVAVGSASGVCVLRLVGNQWALLKRFSCSFKVRQIVLSESWLVVSGENDKIQSICWKTEGKVEESIIPGLFQISRSAASDQIVVSARELGIAFIRADKLVWTTGWLGIPPQKKIAMIPTKDYYAGIDDVSVTPFEGQCFKRNGPKLSKLFAPPTKLGEVQDICTAMRHFLVATKERIYVLYEARQALKSAEQGNMEKAVRDLPFGSMDAMQWLFELLWSYSDKELSLKLLKTKEFRPLIRHFLKRFEFIVFVENEFGNDERRFVCEVPSDTDTIHKVCSALLTADLTEPDRTLIWRNTGIFEMYSHLEEYDELKPFLSQRPDLSYESVKLFCENSASWILYLASIGEAEKAVKSIRAGNLNGVVIDVIEELMIEKGRNWDFVKTCMPVLFEFMPKSAMKILGCEGIPVSSALRLSKQHWPHYYPRILWQVLHNTTVDSVMEVKEFLEIMGKICADIRKESFDRKRVSFCECVIDDPDCSLTMIESELSYYLTDILEKFHSLLTPEIIDRLLSEVQLERVRSCLYRASGSIKEALNILWGNLEECEKICRGFSDSQSAFRCLVEKMNEELPEEGRLTKIFEVLTRNITYVDISSFLSVIDDNKPVVEVADALEACFRDVMSERKDAEINAAFAKAEVLESDYQRVICESKVIRITPDSRCEDCHRIIRGPFQALADGRLYHLRCNIPNV